MDAPLVARFNLRHESNGRAAARGLGARFPELARFRKPFGLGSSGSFVVPTSGSWRSTSCSSWSRTRGPRGLFAFVGQDCFVVLLDLSAYLAPLLPNICQILEMGDRLEKNVQFSNPEMLWECRKGTRAAFDGRSIDTALSLRTRVEIKSKGRWASEQLVTRHESKACLADSVPHLPKSTTSISFEEQWHRNVGVVLIKKLVCPSFSAKSKRVETLLVRIESRLERSVSDRATKSALSVCKLADRRTRFQRHSNLKLVHKHEA